MKSEKIDEKVHIVESETVRKRHSGIFRIVLQAEAIVAFAKHEKKIQEIREEVVCIVRTKTIRTKKRGTTPS